MAPNPPRSQTDRRGRTRRKAGTYRNHTPTNWANRHNTALRNPAPGWIYVIGAKGSTDLKVGKTTRDVKSRLRDLQTGSPVRLEILAKYRVSNVANAELLIHAALKPWHKKGEWFSCQLELTAKAWAQVINQIPTKQMASPHAWEEAHLALMAWGNRKLKDYPRPEDKPPPGTYIPPLGPPVKIVPKPKRPMMLKKNRKGDWVWIEVKTGKRRH